MGIVLLELIFLLSDGMESTLLEERKKAYGEWQCAFCSILPEEMETIRSNSLIQSVGSIHNSWPVFTEDGNEIRSAGTMDETAIQLCRISLYEGSLRSRVMRLPWRP